MIFLGPDDILVTQKNEGTGEKIVNATQSPQPLITVPATSKDERGLLGMAISTNPSNKTFVFLYYTEKGAKKGEALGNRIYKYKFNENAPKVVKTKTSLPNLPWQPGPGHNGGVLKIGPDNNIYLTIGDVMRTGHNESQLYETQMQNLQNGKEADGRAGILRITQSGQPVGARLIDDSYPLNLFLCIRYKK